MLNNFSISERKVAIIGAGFVGASIAYALTIRKLAREIVLIDIHEEKTIGEALWNPRYGNLVCEGRKL